jgi:hypothetical protein
VPNVCTITGSFNIAYGDMVQSSLQGATRTAAASLQCTKDGKVTVFAKPASGTYVSLRPDSSLRATLKVNGSNGTSGFVIDAKANTPVVITVESTLTTNGTVAPGAFNGAGTAILNVD